MSAEQALLTLLTEKLSNNLLVLPTLPEIAVRVRQAADDPDINLNSMAEVIALDTALAARIIKIANSAFIGRSVKVTTLNQAVTRIGLSQVKNIATAMALEQLFVSHTPDIANRMNQLWRETVKVTAVAMACLKFYLQTHKHESLNLDTLTLAGLVHQIGVLPILAEAEKYPDTFGGAEFLQHAILDFSAPIGIAIMQYWDFATTFSEVVRLSHSTVPNPQVCYVDFIRIGLIASGLWREPKSAELLLSDYLQRGLIPKKNLLQDSDLATWYEEAKTLFC
jgi:HD-like signal output (HDOD) protein